MSNFKNTEAINETEFKESMKTDFGKANPSLIPIIEKGLRGDKDAKHAYGVYVIEKNKLLKNY